MCGLAGVVHGKAKLRLTRSDVQRMCERIAHRGPDGHGVWEGANAILGHRRLSIIDVATGQQPMLTSDGELALVFNGEVYNHGDLREELRARGHVFRTQSDTEVILEAYRAYGVDCPRHLRGMFAFALWDAREQRLLLVRDRLGIKPLFYAVRPEGLVFGSELKAVMASGVVPADIDVQALDDFLAFGFIRTPASIFQDVRALVPGERVVVQRAADGSLSLHSDLFWELPTPVRDITDREEAKHELTRLLHEAVRIRLMSEVPLGAFLSGGIDSSTVVWSMAQQTSGKVRTFSIGFDDPEFDESSMARAVAQHFDTEHHEEVVRPDAVAMLPEICRDFDEPFGDPSAIPTWYLCRMARKQVTVCLSGDGGDELFAGYSRYAAIAREQRLPSLLTTGLSKLAPFVPRELPLRKRFERSGLSGAEHYARFRNNFTPEMRRALYTPELSARIDYARNDDLFQRVASPAHYDAYARAQLADLQGYLPDDILTKVDRTSMAHALEARVPLLDHHLVSFAQRIPSTLNVQAGRSKALLRDIIEPHMPEAVLKHPKRGFSVPLARWLRNELAPRLEAAAYGPTFQKGGLFNADYVKRLVSLHKTGRVNLGFALWQLLVLDVWWQEVLPGLSPGARRR